ncbi:hypothetical protein E1265_31935, partial [Streptomyces sp. 8K308]|uniref:RHS repeat-associated core domain-containing protein n=1 Tax=Streptomyces sp. 8K308 TaxID=2530388 RepID=UPI001043F4FB
RWPLTRHHNGGYTLTNPVTGHTRHFAHPDKDGDCRILAISDRNGNHIDIDYTPDGAPTAIRHSGGYHLTLTTEAGRVTGLALGQTVIRRYAYTDGNLTAVLNPAGQPLKFTYDQRLRVTSWTDTNDRRYAYTYDDRDRCVAEGGEAGHLTVSLAYDGTHPDWPNARVTTLTTAQGATSHHVIDDSHQVIAEIDPLGNITRTEYDEHRHISSWTDALGKMTRFVNNAAGQPVAVTYPDGATKSCEYNKFGLPTRITLTDGTSWSREYDERGNCVAVTDGAGSTTRYAFDERGRPTAVTDALGATTTVRCDAAGLPVEIIDPLGNRTTRGHDAFGRLSESTDATGATTRYWWTVDGRISRLVGPDGATQSWVYDGEGNCLRHTDPNAGESHYEYSHFDLLTARTGPDGVRYEFEHDAALRLTRVTNPRALTWEYEYDAAGRLTTEKDFDGRRVVYERDAVGRTVSRVNAAGQRVGYRYDALGRLITRDVDGAVTRYAYDGAGRMSRATGPDCEVAWQRDPVGRVLAETVNGHTTAFRYDAAGQRVERRTPSGAVTVYGYDAAGRRTSLDSAGHPITFARDAVGRETSRLVEGVLTFDQSWGPDGRLAEQTLTGAGGVLQRRAYTYRPDGLLVRTDDRRGGDTDWELDAAGRVTAVSAREWAETYAYDAAGNQTRAVWPEDHSDVEALGDRTYMGTRLTRAGAVRYEYDTAGRVMARRKARLSRRPNVWRYRWDAEDRLTSVVTPDGTVWRYRYDPFGRRVAKQRMAADRSTVAEETRFTWDGPILVEQTTHGRESAHAVTLTWEHDAGRPIAQSERLSDASTRKEIDARFFAVVTDLVGTPTELVDSSGNLAWQSRRTLWGVTAWSADGSAYTPLRFPGQYHDHESGLHYNYHRYYDPETARYVTQDPLGLAPGPNPSVYPHNPHARIDPLGLAPYPAGANRPRSIALGLDRAPNGDDLLQPFADSLGASTNRDWIADGLVTPTLNESGRVIGPAFDERFAQATANAIDSGGRINFNLDYVNIDDALRANTADGPYGEGGFTNWEFQQILNSPTLYGATDWYIGAERLSPQDVIDFGLSPWF